LSQIKTKQKHRSVFAEISIPSPLSGLPTTFWTIELLAASLKQSQSITDAPQSTLQLDAAATLSVLPLRLCSTHSSRLGNLQTR